MKRRTLLKSLPAVTLLPALLRDAAAQDGASVVYELRVYHAAPGKLADLLARFRNHTVKIFDRHGLKSVAYWTPADEPDKSNTLIYILRHPSREAAAANWKAFGDDPEWKSVRDKSEENGKLTTSIDSTYMTMNLSVVPRRSAREHNQAARIALPGEYP